jgi:hypothetical protein
LSSPQRNNCRDSYPVNMMARITHTRSDLEIDFIGHGYQTHFAGSPRRHLLYVGVYHPAEKKNVVSTRPVPWMTGITSFCSYCRYRWLVTVPSAQIGPESPVLADCTAPQLIGSIHRHFTLLYEQRPMLCSVQWDCRELHEYITIKGFRIYILNIKLLGRSNRDWRGM